MAVFDDFLDYCTTFGYIESMSISTDDNQEDDGGSDDEKGGDNEDKTQHGDETASACYEAMLVNCPYGISLE